MLVIEAHANGVYSKKGMTSKRFQVIYCNIRESLSFMSSNIDPSVHRRDEDKTDQW